MIEDSSDDDEPLIKMIKKAPSDEQLKETVQSLLKEADLEEMTMKQICQRVHFTPVLKLIWKFICYYVIMEILTALICNIGYQY